MRKICFLFYVCLACIASAQDSKNSELNIYTEADTILIPDRIYVSIKLNEKDIDNEKNFDNIQNNLYQVLLNNGIIIEKQLTVKQSNSLYSKKFLGTTKVYQSTHYELLLYTANEVQKIITALQEIHIANCSIIKKEVSNKHEIELKLYKKAVQKSKDVATSMVESLDQKIGKSTYMSNTQFVTFESAKEPILIRGYGNYTSNYSEYNIENKTTVTPIQLKVNVQVIYQLLP